MISVPELDSTLFHAVSQSLYLSVSLSLSLSACLPVRLSACLLDCLSNCCSACLSLYLVSLFVTVGLRLFVCLSPYYLTVILFVSVFQVTVSLAPSTQCQSLSVVVCHCLSPQYLLNDPISVSVSVCLLSHSLPRLCLCFSVCLLAILFPPLTLTITEKEGSRFSACCCT